MKYKKFILEDIRSGRMIEVRAKNWRTLEKRLGPKQYSEILVRQVK